jgi:purine-nucleoside phosphorylase
MLEQLQEAVDFIKSKGVISPQIGIVLGTGLGNLFPKHISTKAVIDYGDIPHFPISTVETHTGKLVFGEVSGRAVLAMHGRFHYYEGYTMQQVTFPIRVMKLLGIKYLLISNASGKLNPGWKLGELMVIKDHINLFPENPLRGKNFDQLGPRFPDMSRPYDHSMNKKLFDVASKKSITLHSGIYAGVMGPQLETSAEYRFLRTIGADAVGMSTVPEVIVANHMSLPCCAISVLTDDCDPDNLKQTSLEEIIAIARTCEKPLTELFVGLIGEL